jgi:hypothetical protein
MSCGSTGRSCCACITGWNRPDPPADGDQQAEIRRLEAMGAKVIAVGEGAVDWVIMKDPEGNGFSVLSPRD